ncbi:hypothetical protein L1049_018567 [Liquidambar formosana]|uniref:SWIM-type domain-containing protein n=1 Tax=Liquidambar formosana TaxID=63359 RepID=A0AAP0WLW4_LIQFO
MEFDKETKASDYYNEYGRGVGFSIRRQYRNKSKTHGCINTCLYVCSNEGVLRKKVGAKSPKNPRSQTKTECLAKMGIWFNENTRKYEINMFVEEHNHELAPKGCSYMLRSQRCIFELQGNELVMAEEAGLSIRDTYYLMSTQAGGRESLGFTKLDQKNYFRSRRMSKLAYGEADSLMRYFEEQTLKNPSFYHAVQFDNEEQITNIFGADARMIIDYSQFGDVVSFDTTYKINKEHRPFAVFVGFNHHQEVVVFGAALMYNETIESFEWLCKWHIMQNATKYVRCDVDDGENIIYMVYNDDRPGVVHVKRCKSNDHLSCSCRLFEMSGILCRHALKVFREVLLDGELPDQYILKRWTRDARSTNIHDMLARNTEANGKLEEADRYSMMMTGWKKLTDRASKYEDGYHCVIESQITLQAKLEAVIHAHLNREVQETVTVQETASAQGTVEQLVDDDNSMDTYTLKRKNDPFKGKRRVRSGMKISIDKAKAKAKAKARRIEQDADVYIPLPPEQIQQSQISGSILGPPLNTTLCTLPNSIQALLTANIDGSNWTFEPYQGSNNISSSQMDRHRDGIVDIEVFKDLGYLNTGLRQLAIDKDVLEMVRCLGPLDLEMHVHVEHAVEEGIFDLAEDEEDINEVGAKFKESYHADIEEDGNDLDGDNEDINKVGAGFEESFNANIEDDEGEEEIYDIGLKFEDNNAASDNNDSNGGFEGLTSDNNDSDDGDFFVSFEKAPYSDYENSNNFISGNDSSDDDSGVRKPRYPEYKEPEDINNIMFELGKVFKDPPQLKASISDYAIAGGYNIRFSRNANDKSGFRAGCKPLIGVDGSHLKGHSGMQLLAGVGWDGNDQMYLIDYAVVEAETKEAWIWFLRLLFGDIRSPNHHK